VSESFREGDYAEVLCSDGEWRAARLETVEFRLVWRFPDGLLRPVESSEARDVEPPPLDDSDALERWLDS
jgi:hypothetical protein